VVRRVGGSNGEGVTWPVGSATDGRLTVDDPGLDDEPITDVRWMASVPDSMSEDETVQHTVAVVEDRFAWLD